jgi:hypothetical protein
MPLHQSLISGNLMSNGTTLIPRKINAAITVHQMAKDKWLLAKNIITENVNPESRYV